MQKFTPCLWFDHQAEEAANFYVSIFKNSKILSTSRYSEEVAKVAGRPAGSVMTVSFQLEGQEFIGLNGGPMVQFNQAISFMVNCETQADIDYLWEKLSAAGQTQQCGWLQDKFGISWQIIPRILNEWMTAGDIAWSERVMKALLQMDKLDIKGLQQAYEGR
jgi:predicted 3-demethylubiquinone-9 3-methyltransferase (glyoxalase superfamily)